MWYMEMDKDGSEVPLTLSKRLILIYVGLL